DSTVAAMPTPVEPTQPVPVSEAPKAAPPVAPIPSTVATVQAPVAPVLVVASHPTLSAAAAREAALEAGVAPPQTTGVDAPSTKSVEGTPAAPKAPVGAESTAPSATQAPVAPAATSASATERLYIRIGTFRSRTHARHVAARLRGHRLAENLNP